jgi:hypothetical protein
MLYDLTIPTMRIFAAFSHLFMLAGAIWTRAGMILVTMGPYPSQSGYDEREEDFLALVGASIVFLLFEMVYLAVTIETITLASCIHLFLDIVATIFIAWMILDSLDWRTMYVIFSFCTFLPALYDALQAVLYLYARQFVVHKRKKDSFLCFKIKRD